MASDHYRTLKVAPDATADELRSAYLVLARANHPDRFDGDRRQTAELRMQEINAAWNVLGAPHTRKEYDALRRFDHGGSGAYSGGDPLRGNAHFSPFDDDPIDRSDVDLDPTPMARSRGVPRWISLMPVLLFVAGIFFLGFGFLLNAGVVVAFAAIVVLLGGVGFLLMPLIVMSRAERDPGL